MDRTYRSERMPRYDLAISAFHPCPSLAAFVYGNLYTSHFVDMADPEGLYYVVENFFSSCGWPTDHLVIVDRSSPM